MPDQQPRPDTAATEVRLLTDAGVDLGYANHLAHTTNYDLATELVADQPAEWGAGEALQAMMDGQPEDTPHRESDTANRIVFLTRAAAQLGFTLQREEPQNG